MKFHYEVRPKASTGKSAWDVAQVVAEDMVKARKLGAAKLHVEPDQVYAVCKGLVEDQVF